MIKLTIVALIIAAMPLFNAAVLARAEEGHGRDRQALATEMEDAAPARVFDREQPDGTKAICPITGDSLVVSKDTTRSNYKEHVVYFCCPACKPTFDADPEKYLEAGPTRQKMH